MTADTLRIRNWDKWQSYRGDRGQPPWIKIHRCVMRNPQWVALTDAQRGQLVAIWLLAADHDGVIPASPSLIRKLCYLDTEPDLILFTEHGFIEPDANVTPERRQHDVPETETEAETETETEREIAAADATDIASDPIADSVDDWNAMADRTGLAKVQRLTNQRRSKLKARLRECGGREGWQSALAKMEAIPGLLGSNDRGWRADFDFMLQEKTFTKLMEGGYDHWTGKPAKDDGLDAFARAAAGIAAGGSQAFG